MEKEKILFNKKNLPVNVLQLKMEKGKKIRGMHFHKAIEVVKVKKGSIKCFIGDEEVTLDDRNILVIAPQVIHRLCHFMEDAEITYMQIDIEEFLKAKLPDSETASLLFFVGISTKPYILFNEKSDFSDIFDITEREYYKSDIYSDGALYSCISLMTTLLCRGEMFSNLGEIKKSKDILSLLPAIRYIEENYKSKISLDGVSADLHVDKFNFCKSFKSATGMTFIEYLNLRRLKNAEEMLTASNSQISEIAFESGFTSIQNFNRFFKKTKGISPLTYRKMHYEKTQNKI